MAVVQLANFGVEQVTGGGTSRSQALDLLVDGLGGTRIVVQDARWNSGRLHRYLRPFSILVQLKQAKPDVLVLRYPGFPFFWSSHRNLDLKRALIFLGRLRSFTKANGVRVVIDILDLLRYASPNPEMKLGIDDALLGKFEEELFGFADEIWACSYSIARHLVDTYALPTERVRVVLNGGFRLSASAHEPAVPASDGEFRFFYAGDLARVWRGTEIMLDGFVGSVTDPSARLVICGANGEWIKDEYSDPRIVNLGVLPSDEIVAWGRTCKVGLIPQPESGYYHMAFPTKLGLYLTLGMPIITTRAEEAAGFVERHGVGLVASADRFGEYLNQVVSDPALLEPMRAKSCSMADGFYWDSIYGEAWDSFQASRRPT